MFPPALAALAFAGILSPDRLRVDGSDFTSGNDASVAYAVRHDRRLQFTWAPRHTQGGSTHRAFELTVADAMTGERYWASGVRASSDAMVHYEGQQLQPGRLYKWAVAWSEDGAVLSDPSESYFRTGLADEDWAGVGWIGANDTNLYRAAFAIPSGAARTTLYICGLGFSDTTVNGKPAAPGSALVSAPWTTNFKQNMFSTYDITPSVAAGANVMAVELGHGWRDRGAFPSHDDAAEGYDPARDTVTRVFRAVVEVQFANGTVQRVLTSSGGWNATQGPVVADSVYDGETYDARIAAALVGMHGTAYTVSPPLWRAAAATPGPAGVMLPWAAPAVMVEREYPAVKITYPVPGMAVVDFGANVAGVLRLKNIDLPAGKNVTLRHGECLCHPGLPDLPSYTNGTIYTGNLRTAKATDVFISKGTVAEYMPRFTYHGFRYAEITGYSGTLSAADVSLVHFHSAIRQRTNATFAAPLLNALQRLAVGAQRSNAMTLMTDCPQRDERLGWMGDSALSSDSYALNFDSGAFFRHIIGVQASELNLDDGSLPDTVPFVRFGGRPADVSWSISLAQLINVGRKAFGDVETAKEYLPAVELQLANVQRQAAAGLAKMATPYGDWCPPPPNAEHPSQPYTSAFSYVQMTDIAAELAAAAGNASAAARHANEAAALREQFHDAFYHAGKFDTDVMTSYALAAALNHSADVADAHAGLVRLVGAHKAHLSTGIIGMKALYDALDAAGRHDLSLAVLEQTDYPSLGYMLTNPYEPATENLWELLDAPVEGTTMNSRNHHMWSSYSSYLVRRFAGVDLLSGTLRPPPLDLDLPGATTEAFLANGELEFEWQRVGGVQCAKGFVGEATHPHANTVALSCGAGGGTVDSVLFASLGAATGTHCGAYKAAPACHHPQSEAMVAAACVGQASCTVDLRSFSALPCATHMRVAVQCSGAAETRVAARVPIGGDFAIEVPRGAVLRNAVTGEEHASGQRHALPSGASSFVLKRQS